MSYPLKISKTNASRLGEVDLSNIAFGRIFSDHMLVADYSNGKWQDAQIMPFQKLQLHPAISALHYGQSIFEGLKAYKTVQGNPVIFRPEENWQRINRSAIRMAMPEIPRELFMEGMDELIKLDESWIPEAEGSSLYIRPFMFATDEYVGIKPSENYKFIVFTCPVNAYYSEPVKVLIEENYARAVKGGTGAAKVAGNYAASLYPALLAQKKGFRQLIWTDALEHKYLEESGTMNIFVQIGDKVITPTLDQDTILHGITRKSIIKLMNDKGIQVEERRIAVQEVLEAYESGNLKDMFGAGTAATIAHISEVGYRDKVLTLPPVGERELSNGLLKDLDNIKKGRTEDTHNWLHHIK